MNVCDGHGTFVREQLGVDGPYDAPVGDCEGCPACTLTQTVPFPHELADLVEHCTYRRGWTVYLQDHDRGQGSRGLTLFIVTDTVNSYDHDQRSHVAHLFIVPAAAYDRRSWQRWLFEQFHLVELHECMEFFEIDGTKPYAPSHGPGNDPYLIREVGTDEDRRTSFTGRLNP